MNLITGWDGGADRGAREMGGGEEERAHGIGHDGEQGDLGFRKYGIRSCYLAASLSLSNPINKEGETRPCKRAPNATWLDV